MSEVLLIPGYEDQADGEPRNYPNFVDGLSMYSHNLVPLRMDWSDLDPRGWADQVHAQTRGKRIDTVVGHSFGGITALVFMADLAKERMRPMPSLVLASHSARFEDDLQDPDVEAYVRGRHNGIPVGFQGLRIEPFVNAITPCLHPSEVAVFVGEQEVEKLPFAGRRAEKTAALFDVPMRTIPDAPHHFDISLGYVNGVISEINKVRTRRKLLGVT